MNPKHDDIQALLQSGERIDSINENLRLIQKVGGLTFGTDAYLLAAFAKAVPAGTAVDLGSGTGVAALLCLTRQKFRHMYAVELQEEFADLIRRNARLNMLDDHLSVLTKDARLLSCLDTDGEVHTVISNPPYMPAGSGFSSSDTRMEIARRENNGTIFDFCKAAATVLRTGGSFYTVFRPERMTDLFFALRKNCLEPKKLVTIYPDAQSRPCLILCEAKKGAAPSLLQPPPLVIYREPEHKTYTDDMQKIYDTFSFDHLFTMKKGSRQ